ncbi:hypothetical protein [Brevundimonas sp.]|uniref:hypothetical protein n=1 Tax=Brevundimonas sp. TaxID=1871086 RepID=UPI002D78F18E|nr:hypothetical protein [Brevundimonas sp.]
MAAAGAVIAADHMALAASLCGPVASHCVLCVASAGSLLASAGVFGSGLMLLRTTPLRQRARQATRGLDEARQPVA